MLSSWFGSFTSRFTIPRRGLLGLGAIQALESRALLSALGGGEVTSAPVVYGPLQISESSAVAESASMVTEDAAKPAPIPVITPQDYNGMWIIDSVQLIELKVNSRGTKVKGTYFYPLGKDFKLKGKLDDLDVTAVGKGKGVISNENEKIRLELTFTLLNPVTWKGDIALYISKKFAGSEPVLAMKIT